MAAQFFHAGGRTDMKLSLFAILRTRLKSTTNVHDKEFVSKYSNIPLNKICVTDAHFAEQ